MARPIVLVFLLLVVAFASQFEWEEQSGNEVEELLSISQKQRHNSKREESVKEKVRLHYFSILATVLSGSLWIFLFAMF